MGQVQIVAEIGINHGGNLHTAKQLIAAAHEAGADVVKFQKRTIAAVYSPEELAKPRASVYGTTNGDLKRGLEFGPTEYDEIDRFCHILGLAWTASAWDVASVAFLAAYRPPFLKIASASLTDHAVLDAYTATGLPCVLSTGMSTMVEISDAIDHLDRDRLTLLACTSTYPCPEAELNLRQIGMLRDRYGLPVGFSSHAVSPWPCVYAAVLGATMIEAHLTLDRSMWGSDQAASLEPAAFGKMVREIRGLDVMLGDGEKRVYPSEEPIRAKLRKKVYA